MTSNPTTEQTPLEMAAGLLAGGLEVVPRGVKRRLYLLRDRSTTFYRSGASIGSAFAWVRPAACAAGFPTRQLAMLAGLAYLRGEDQIEFMAGVVKPDAEEILFPLDSAGRFRINMRHTGAAL